MSDSFFHLSFIVLFTTFSALRVYYQWLATRIGGKAESRDHRGMRAVSVFIGIPFILLVTAYMVRPALLAWATLPLPVWLQWLGLGMGVFSLILLWWIHHSLGINFSPTLHIRHEHTLVTAGPYRWVRHPMYTAMFLFLTSVLLLTQNWLIGGGFLIPFILIVATRLKHEEAVMTEKFGDTYRAYMQQTGRFVPKML